MMKNKLKILYYLIVLLLLNACTKEPDIMPKTQSLALSPTSGEIKEGDSLKLTPQINPSNAQPIIAWTSSNEKVATVSQNGMVKALARGSVTITAIADDSIEANASLTITREDLPYQLVWSDEFDGNALDLSKWNIETGGGGWGNQEKQYYTGRSQNLRVENGNLVIEALKEAYENNAYTSARITTKNKAMFTYGKMEARISLPAGKGTWPAFWMLGTYGSWPLCGEVDIMEHIGSQPTMISHAVHTYEKNGSRGNNWYNRQYRDGIENNFHTYAIEWEKKYSEGQDCINFYIDGVKSATIWEQLSLSDQKTWPFNKDFFLILNVAIGGTMGGTIDDAIFNNPVMMKVDYVRVYQRE
ncbi:Beta-glucanase (modular protein) [uncultured Paludibacter sp.]|nr:Beta-glucanase (modular protein) [uncultured Paludibacter sp.]